MFGKKAKKLLERASDEAEEFKRPYPEPKSDLEGLAKRESQPPLPSIRCPTCGGFFALDVCPTDGTHLTQ